jgi:nicotinamide-nucleotide amidase
MGSVIAYANSVKTQLLGVPMNILDSHGSVSKETVELMAEGVRKLFNTDFAVATTGIAGPDGGTTEKPVGTVWIGVADGDGVVSEKFIYGNDRVINIKRFSFAALNMLRKQIISK